MEKNPPNELVEFLGRYSAEVAEVFLATRDKAYEYCPEATEFVTNASYTVACGYTFTHSIKHAFLYVGAYAKHVNLGFNLGTSLPDPESKLKGDGKFMRHLSYKTVEDLVDPYADELLRQTTEMAHRPDEPLIPKTVITKMKK